MGQRFKSSTEELRLLIEDISAGILALDVKGKIVYINRTAETILNRKRAGLEGKNIWEEFPGSVGGQFHRAFHEALSLQKSLFREEYSSILGKWTRMNFFPSSKGVTVCLHDITSQKKTEDIVKKTEPDYGLFLDQLTNGFISLDKDFRVVFANKKFGELVQCEPSSLSGKPIVEVFPEAINSLTYKALKTAFKEQRFISNIDHFESLKLWLENHIYPSSEGLSVFVKDISETKKLEKRLRETELNRQFELMVTALETQEKERTFIGRELHDNVNQLLVATQLLLTTFKNDSSKDSLTIISKCIGNLEKAIKENRRISHELVTPDLKEETLVEQLKALAHSMLSSNNIQTVIQASHFDESQLDEAQKLAVYRIAQEQCTNIVKYAKAKQVRIELSTCDGIFTMIIADNGTGSAAEKLTAGIGLRNIGARTGFLGGDIHIKTQPGKGFQLTIMFPTKIAIPACSN